MKNIFYVLIFISTACYCQNGKPDSLQFIYQDFLQKQVDTRIEDKIINLDNEILYRDPILDTSEKAILFCENLLNLKFPVIKKKKVKFSISEDKSSKLWFVNARFSDYLLSFTGKDVNFIVIKDNCKVIFFEVIK